MVYIRNRMLISKATKSSYTSLKPKYLGTRPLIIQNLTQAYGQYRPLKNIILKDFQSISYIEIIMLIGNKIWRILIDFNPSRRVLNIGNFKSIRSDNLKSKLKNTEFPTLIVFFFRTNEKKTTVKY